MIRTRTATFAASLVLAPVLLLASGVLFGGSGGAERAASTAGQGARIAAGNAAGPDDLAALQERLRRLPGDYTSWSALGFGYLAQARSTADATFYAKAEEAFARSLAERPEENSDALAGRAALANARHQFARGRELAAQAVAINPYGSTARGVLADSLVELGEYDEAWGALQRMVDLRPGVASFTRIAHSYELRGDPTGARIGLERALAAAAAPADASYALFYLAELAFNSGDHRAAADHLTRGIRIDPGHVPLLALQARLDAARGATEAALSGYARVVEQLPQPSYLVEYGELLESLGRTAAAQEQYRIADAIGTLFAAAGVVPDVESVLYDADHGRPAQALDTARRHYETRRSVQVSDALAWALHVNGRDREALEHARAAQRLGTENALWHYHRGMIEKSLGLTKQARASLRAALAANPEFSPRHAPLARAALAELAGRP